MAIRLGDIFVAIRAENDKLKGDLDAAKGQATSWASGLAGTLKGALGGALLGGVATLTGAVAGIGVAAFSAASDFDAATKKMQSQLGTSDEIAKKYGDTLKDIFANNFGDSIDDVANSITEVNRAFERIGGVESNQELQQATEAAIALRDTFDAEVNETTSAAVTLMQNFGISATEAFDLVAYGFQNGLDGSGDFLDSIGEYSTQFSNGGATAEQFFSVLQTGLQGGMLGTDKAADAFKEFGIRIQDGSALTADGLKRLGLNSGEIMRGLSDGSLEVVDVFQQVIGALNNIDDPLVRAQAGVALLGTQYEDLGDSAVLALDASGISLQKVAGSINSLNAQYNTIPAFFEGLRRRALVAIEPIGGALLNVFNKSLPFIEEWFTSVEGWITDFIANSSFEWGPDIKQIKLGNLFEWVQSDALGGTRIKLADFFDLTWTDAGIQKLTLGDVFSFSAGEGTSINLADFITFVYDAQSGAVALTISDVFTFVTDENGTVINLADYVKFVYDNEGNPVLIKVGELYKLEVEGDKTTIDIANVVEFTGTPTDNTTKISLANLFDFATPLTYDQIVVLKNLPAITKMVLGDFFGFSLEPKVTQNDVFDLSQKQETPKYTLNDFIDFVTGGKGSNKITVDDLFDFSADKSTGIVKLTLGDFVAFNDGETAKITWGDIFDLSRDNLGITRLTINDFITFERDAKGNISLPDFQWNEFITKLVWGEYIPNLTWSDWALKILWADYVPGMSWSDYLDKVPWGDYVNGLSWSDFIPKLSWPAAISGFSWKSFITGIDLSALVPTFPGWTTLFNQLNPFGSAPADVNPGATSSGSIGGSGRSGLTRSGPLVQIDNVNVTDRQDVEALAYGIARRLAYR